MFGVQGLGALLQAFTGSSDANVLSTPNLIPLDNEEAKINVGQNVPIATGSHSNLTSSSNRSAFNTYDRRDVGLTLHVKPQITEDGILKLRLYTEDSSVVNGTTDATTNPAGPTLNERSIQSTVLADNDEIIRITYYYAKPRHRLRESKGDRFCTRRKTIAECWINLVEIKYVVREYALSQIWILPVRRGI